MGTYTSISVAGYEMWSTKKYVDATVMTLFREEDRLLEVCSLPNDGVADDPACYETYDSIVYRISVKQAIDRMNVMGFTMEHVRREYERVQREELGDVELVDLDEFENSREDAAGYCQVLTFDEYLQALREVLPRGLYLHELSEAEQELLKPDVAYIIGLDPWPVDSRMQMGFWYQDIRCLIRVACEISPPDSFVEQDVSGVVEVGYYSSEERISEVAVVDLIGAYSANANRIILTEGSSDSRVLKEALELLHPHLAGYYSFLDFQSANVPGGASFLGAVVKSFAATGVANRIIAVFDNDTAGAEARELLGELNLPANIAVIAYPDMPLFSTYPTLGPSGERNLDVNGLAASLELYLGRDVLEAEGALRPVQWTGYNRKMKRYQGEVLGKAKIHKAFQQKARACKADCQQLEVSDWSGLEAIWESIRSAFEE